MSEAATNHLYREMFDFYWKSHPVAATAMGIHHYDHHYGDYSEEYREEHYQTLRHYLNVLQNMDESQLSEDEK